MLREARDRASHATPNDAPNNACPSPAGSGPAFRSPTTWTLVTMRRSVRYEDFDQPTAGARRRS